jgi:hypothetical protein
MNETPSARSLAILVSNVGSRAVDGNSFKQASIGGHNRPHPDLLPNSRAVSRTCSATALINGNGLDGHLVRITDLRLSSAFDQ